MPTADDIDAFALKKLKTIDAKGLTRRLAAHRRELGGACLRSGAKLISFSDNDYLGLSVDARVKEAAASAAMEYGAGAGASRLVTGNHDLYEDLESRLARMKQTQSALVFGSGYLANISLIPTLAGPGDVIFLDALAHACMHAGARLSGAQVESFAHNDIVELAARLEASTARRKLVLTETVFSMDGDLASLYEIAALCESHDAWLITDDAHGFGVIEQSNPAPVQMGTLSKAVGAYGGYVCGSQALIDLLINRARGLIYTTGLPPAALGAAIAALDIMASEPDRRARLIRNAVRFTDGLGQPPPQSAIIPIIFGDADKAMRASAHLAEEDFLVTAIRPPTVPEGTARLRVALSSEHRLEDVERLAQLIAALQEELR